MFLDYNGTEGGKALGEGLVSNTTLMFLSLSESSFNSSLLETFRKNKGLVILEGCPNTKDWQDILYRNAKEVLPEKVEKLRGLELQTKRLAKQIKDQQMKMAKQMKEMKKEMKRKKKEKEENTLDLMIQRILRIAMHGLPWVELNMEQVMYLKATFDKQQNALGNGAFGRGMVFFLQLFHSFH